MKVSPLSRRHRSGGLLANWPIRSNAHLVGHKTVKDQVHRTLGSELFQISDGTTRPPFNSVAPTVPNLSRSDWRARESRATGGRQEFQRAIFQDWTSRMRTQEGNGGSLEKVRSADEILFPLSLRACSFTRSSRDLKADLRLFFI